MEKLTLVKAGGRTLDSEQELNRLMTGFAAIGGKKILVHGGGVFIDELCDKLNIPTQMVDGRRITSPGNMDVVLMAVAGKLNKQLVAGLNQLGMQAVGLCGADLNLITSHKRNPLPIDFGMVGDIDIVNTHWLKLLVDHGAVPVISSVTQSDVFELLNTNADTIAAHIAKALSSEYELQLYFYFDKPGVLRDSTDDKSVLETLSLTEFERLKSEKAVHKGMLPKLQNGFYALNQGVKTVCLGNKLGNATEISGTLLIN